MMRLDLNDQPAILYLDGGIPGSRFMLDRDDKMGLNGRLNKNWRFFKISKTGHDEPRLTRRSGSVVSFSEDGSGEGWPIQVPVAQAWHAKLNLDCARLPHFRPESHLGLDQMRRNRDVVKIELAG